MNALEFLTQTTKEGASDLFIVAGRPLSYKKGGKLTLVNEERMMPAQCETMIREIYELAGHRNPDPFLLPEMMTFPLQSRDFPDTVSALTCSAVLLQP